MHYILSINTDFLWCYLSVHGAVFVDVDFVNYW